VVKNKFHFSPLEKLLKKSTVAPPGKHFFDTHALQNYTIFRINCVVFHHLATLFSNTNVVSHSMVTDYAQCILPNNYEILPNYK